MSLETGRRPAEQVEGDLAERLRPLTKQDAFAEASRCLYCFDAPCMVACPTSIDIPGFIKLIQTDDRLGSAQRILEENVLGASCARVCAVEELCEEACVLAPGEGPIMIGRLQRHATDEVYGDADGFARAGIVAGVATGRSVAVVGGGPAGLAAAAELRVAGHDVTIFDRQPTLGGLTMYGIIPLREPSEVALWEADQVLALGAVARTGVEIGRDVTADDLRRDFDAVFLANGSGQRVSSIGLAGDDAPGVEDALEFIERIRVERPSNVPVGRDVVIVGAGNTAMDAATIAARLGADTVTCVYRRTQLEMTGYPNEYEHCLGDGVRFRWLTQPLRVLTGEDGHVSGLECAVVRLGAPGPDGRPVPEVSDELVTIACDHVLLATGQRREPQLFEHFGLETEWDRPKMTGAFHTTDPAIFAGGDAVLSGKELSVVDAVAQGRDAARAIGAYLEDHPRG
ncbi:MAG: FAD-dependent pyridine nucleotide-disulfide oxidoreductase [Thermoleophilia bacterium]|nr:FAD-dependent pyridine nucleotide-disulfide oxidoreductase [Thermoleophilia bacterium]